MDRFEMFTVSILRINKLIQRIKLHEMEEYGLKAIHVSCMYYLAKRPEGLTAGELITLSLEDKAAISRALDILTKKGLINYSTKKYKTRAVLTEEGKRIAAEVEEKSLRAVSAGGDSLDEDKRADFYETIGKIADNLYEYYKQLLAADGKQGN